jgi:YesN/AraC family two-component response regulator
VVATKGEYVITPAGKAYDYYCPRGTVSSMFSFYLDVGEEGLVSKEEIVFEHSDNYVYVDLESLFIPIKGKMTLSGKAYSAMKQLIGNYDADTEYVNVMASAKVIEVLIALAERSVKDILKQNAEYSTHGGVYSYCERIDKYIEKNYMYPITMTTISRLLVKHENYISRIYKNVRGITVMNHLQNVRIENAKQLLIGGKYSVAQVAKMVGYPDPKYFITVFKKIESISPGKYCESLFGERTFSYDIPQFIDEE